MNLDDFRHHCLALPGAEETMPFGPDVLVFKVGGKMFATASYAKLPAGAPTDACSVNLKCDPEKALELRDLHEDITPGYHMNKRHWNTLDLSGRLPAKLVCELIAHSHQLVKESANASLPKKARKANP